ncbi:unnamed protein product [Cyclocybe aegerita]|uniref:F-box domain-containing protein n=1 Tax=Cyclocybe aegerita TaxID=1973307 RepID=A0A8S0VWC7_CYCAE|nr:unnamed protein product [Cyclocybe aegerita]
MSMPTFNISMFNVNIDTPLLTQLKTTTPTRTFQFSPDQAKPDMQGSTHHYIEEETHTSCTTCTVSGGGRCSACEQLLVLYKKIEGRLKALQQLQIAVFELKSQQNRQHDLLVNRLPAELLVQIFTKLLPPRPGHQPSTFFQPLIRDEEEPEPPSWATKSGPSTLSRVCRRWRDVIRSTPQMWTSIVVNVDQEEKEYAEFVNEQFLRSGALPVWVKVHQPSHGYTSSSRQTLPPPHTVRLLDIVNTHSARWKSLKICLGTSMLQYVCGNPQSNCQLYNTCR